MTEQEFDFVEDVPQTPVPAKAESGQLATPPADAPKFEEALERLETVVEEMESGSLSLDESMKYFEEGMKLAGFCTERLAETEKKVEILLKKNSADAQWAPLPGSEGSAEEEF